MRGFRAPGNSDLVTSGGMEKCVQCANEVPAAEALVTADGPLCQACYDQQSIAVQDRRAVIAKKLAGRDAENMFGDATFDPNRRKWAVRLFVLTLLLLLVLYALKLASVL